MTKPGCLVDTGPLVALLDKDDQNHERAKACFLKLHAPLVTCESVISEACFLLRQIHPAGPQELVSLALKGLYEVPFKLQDQWKPIQSLLAKYRDRPISLADACLIRCAELYQEPRILTFDSDFGIYRWNKNKSFLIMD